MWMDMRSAEQTKAVLATADPALRVNSGGEGPVSAEWMIPKALWLQQNEPLVFEAAAHICEAQVSPAPHCESPQLPLHSIYFHYSFVKRFGTAYTKVNGCA
jgi:hypothetical protein